MDILDLAQIALRRSLEEIGYSKAGASELAAGKRKPSIERAADIERRIGIPAAAWADGPPLQQMWNIMKKRAD